MLITGASRGLGLVLAREFAKHGARIAICARDQSELEHVVDELGWMGENFLAVTCDVTVRENVETMTMHLHPRSLFTLAIALLFIQRIKYILRAQFPSEV